MYLTETIQTIDLAIKEGLKGRNFQRANYFGLIEREKKGTQYIPSSNDKFVIDDSQNMVIYHRHLSIGFGVNESFSGEARNVQEANQMLLVCYANEKLKVKKDSMISLIASLLMRNITVENEAGVRTQITIAPTNGQADSVALWSQEMGNLEYKLKATDIFFSINYSATMEINSRCASLCITC